MTKAEIKQRQISLASSGGVCEVCQKPLNKMQGAHRIANTKTNRAKWGNWIIDHPMNIAIVCSLECNHVCNIGFNPGECLKLIKKIVDKEIKKYEVEK